MWPSVLSMSLAAAALLTSSRLARASPEVLVMSTSGASNLALDGGGTASTHVVKVASLTLSTGGAHGLTASITSGALIRVGGGAGVPAQGTQVAFQVVLVNHNAAAPFPAAFTTPPGALYVFSTGAAATAEQDLYIQYRPTSSLPAGGYTASIDIQANDN